MKKNPYWLVVGAAAAAGAVGGAALVTRIHITSIDQVIQPLWISIALYCAFSLYWTYAAKNSAPVRSSEHAASTILHQLLLNASIVFLFFRIPGLTGRWLPRIWWLMPLGILIQMSAIALAVWARKHLGANWSAAVVAKVDHQLVRTGPYKLIRHPIYTAMLGMYSGISIASGEWHAVVGLAMLMLAYTRKIRLEEQTMSRLFGDEHADYRQSSWALIPWII